MWRLSRRVSSVSRKVTCTWRPAIVTWQLALAGASGKGGTQRPLAVWALRWTWTLTACMARRWMPAGNADAYTTRTAP